MKVKQNILNYQFFKFSSMIFVKALTKIQIQHDDTPTMLPEVNKWARDIH